MTVRNLTQLPPDLPVPVDDGAARHLVGMKMPDLGLAATDGTNMNLSKLSRRTVVYAYPRTGEPGRRGAGRCCPAAGARARTECRACRSAPGRTASRGPGRNRACR